MDTSNFNRAVKEFSEYASGLLEHVADELNIKEIRFDTQYGPVVYHYDIIRQKGVGFDKPELSSQVLTGNLMEDMDTVRRWVNIGLSQRSKAGIKVRQPLQSMTISGLVND